jgi:protein-S-isoprenylcysteine O-methyltransferase Ste14
MYDNFDPRNKAMQVKSIFRDFRFRQKIFKGLGFLVFLIILIRHLTEFSHYPSAVLWALEGALFLGFLLAYVIRRDPVLEAVGFKERFFPFVCAVLPFALIYDFPTMESLFSLRLESVLKYSPWQNHELYPVIKWLMIAGTALTVSALFQLRSAFSIMTEARVHVSSGVYRLISHPMYVGEVVTAAGSAWLRGGPEKWFFFVVFVLCQWYRARLEEKKMSLVFSDFKNRIRSCVIRF